MSQVPFPVEFPTPVQFPKTWKWFMDQRLTQWVKDQYSPKESWKGKPFNEDDAHFFFKGIDELSEIFTQDRGRALSRYFEHPRFRSGYLLYFLPLQAAKFVAVFDRHRAFLLEAVKAAAQKGSLSVVDLGAGPLTASIALVMWLFENVEELPEIHITAVDSQPIVLREGAELLQALGDGFPKLRGKVRTTVQTARWQDWAKAHARAPESADLYLLGHVLNEGRDHQPEGIASLIEKNPRAGILAIEPAAKNTSQSLSQLRDLLLEEYPVSPVGALSASRALPARLGRRLVSFFVSGRNSRRLVCQVLQGPRLRAPVAQALLSLDCRLRIREGHRGAARPERTAARQ